MIALPDFEIQLIQAKEATAKHQQAAPTPTFASLDAAMIRKETDIATRTIQDPTANRNTREDFLTIQVVHKPQNATKDAAS